MNSTYSSEELISSSKLVKNFWLYLSKLKEHNIEKIWILKNNKVDAVILSSEDFDIITELLEHLEIYHELKDRLKNDDFIDANEILNKFNLYV